MLHCVPGAEALAQASTYVVDASGRLAADCKAVARRHRHVADHDVLGGSPAATTRRA